MTQDFSRRRPEDHPFVGTTQHWRQMADVIHVRTDEVIMQRSLAFNEEAQKSLRFLRRTFGAGGQPPTEALERIREQLCFAAVLDEAARLNPYQRLITCSVVWVRDRCRHYGAQHDHEPEAFAAAMDELRARTTEAIARRRRGSR